MNLKVKKKKSLVNYQTKKYTSLINFLPPPPPQKKKNHLWSSENKILGGGIVFAFCPKCYFVFSFNPFNFYVTDFFHICIQNHQNFLISMNKLMKQTFFLVFKKYRPHFAPTSIYVNMIPDQYIC